VIQRFGSSSALNVPIHMLLLDGVFVAGPDDAPAPWVRVAAPSTEEVQQFVLVLSASIERWLDQVCWLPMLRPVGHRALQSLLDVSPPVGHGLEGRGVCLVAADPWETGRFWSWPGTCEVSRGRPTVRMIGLCTVPDCSRGYATDRRWRMLLVLATVPTWSSSSTILQSGRSQTPQTVRLHCMAAMMKPMCIRSGAMIGVA
jgi:hypothetical protein